MLNHVCVGASIARYASGIDATATPQSSQDTRRGRSDPAASSTNQLVRMRKKGTASRDVFTAAPAARPVKKIRRVVGLWSNAASHASRQKNMHKAYVWASSPDCATCRF